MLFLSNEVCACLEGEVFIKVILSVTKDLKVNNISLQILHYVQNDKKGAKQIIIFSNARSVIRYAKNDKHG